MSGCPDNTNANDALPQPVSIVNTSSQLQSPSDNISQLTMPTRSHAPSLTSPLRPIDIGVPPTPPENTLIPVDAGTTPVRRSIRLEDSSDDDESMSHCN